MRVIAACTCRVGQRSWRSSAQPRCCPAIYFVFSRAGCDRSVQWLREAGISTHDARRGRPHPGPRGEPRRLDRRGGPGHARVLRLPRRADGGRRRPPRGDAPRLQGDRGGAVRGRAREGGVRDRDAVARHQHARPDRGDRGPVEVPGRATRAPHAGRVHAADGARRPARHRPARPRRRGVPAAGRRSNGWRGSPRRGPTISTRRSVRRTTWRSTWCATTTASRRTSCSTRRSRSSWPTAASCSWSASVERDLESIAGYRANLAVRPRATSTSTGVCCARPSGCARRIGGVASESAVEAIRDDRSPACGRARSSTCRGPAGAASPWSCRPATASRPCSSEDRSYFRLSAKDFDDPPTVLTRIVLPRSGSSRSARYRRDVASKLVSLHVKRPRETRHPADPEVEEKAKALEARAAEHPCASCPERAKHERWAVRADTLERAAEGRPTADPDPHRDARSPVRPGAGGAAGTRVRRRMDRSRRRAGRSRASTARATCWWGSRSRRGCSTISRPRSSRRW